MKKFTRLMALLLSLLMVFSLAACGGNGDENPVDGSKPSGSNNDGDGGNGDGGDAALDMGGATIKVACWWAPLPKADALTEGDRLQAYQLEEAKEKYNVKFEEIVVQQTDMKVNFDAHLLSGDVWADIMYLRAEQADVYAHEGNLKDLTNIVDQDSVEYNQNIRERFTIDGKEYAFTYYADNFDAALSFNKAIFDRAGVAYPYQLVHEKKWTWDKFVETIKAVTIKGADGKTEVYGLYGSPGGYAHYMYPVINKTAIAIDENGNYYNNYGDAEIQNFMNKYRDLMVNGSKEGYVYLPPANAAWNDATSKFKGGRIAITSFSMSGGPTGLADMADDWGVVPKPLGKEGQDWKFMNETQNVQVMPAALEDDWAAKVAKIYTEIYRSPYTDEEREDARRSNFETQLRDKESVDIVYEFTYSYPVILNPSIMMNESGMWATASVPLQDAMRGNDTIGHAIESFTDAVDVMCEQANNRYKK